MSLFVACVVLLFVVWRIRRRARAGVLAGLDAERPVFSVEPPRRRVGRLKDGRL